MGLSTVKAKVELRKQSDLSIATKVSDIVSTDKLLAATVNPLR